MKTKLLHQDGKLRTYLAVLAIDDEVMSCLDRFARAEKLSAAHITALGAFREAELKYFDWESRQYQSIPVKDQVEVAAMVGDIALDADGEPALHVHVVLGTRTGAAVAGHLARAYVRPTLEVVIEEAPAHLRRLKDQDSGLALIRPEG